MKELKNMVQFCPNTQPIYGAVYPTETRGFAEWFIGRPDSDFRFRYFINEVHVRELIASIPEELRDSITGFQELKGEYEEEITRLKGIIAASTPPVIANVKLGRK